jgi:hypothetical protein
MTLQPPVSHMDACGDDDVVEDGVTDGLGLRDGEGDGDVLAVNDGDGSSTSWLAHDVVALADISCRQKR